MLFIGEFRLFSSNFTPSVPQSEENVEFVVRKRNSFSSLDEPSWRPRFRFYHWILSLLGVVVCVTIMLISSWYIALLTWSIGGIVFSYIWYSGVNKEWGEGLKGLPISLAHVALSRLDDRPMHTKNFRPQILSFTKCVFDENQRRWTIEHEKMIHFLSQLKAGKGLIILATVIEGKYEEKRDEVEQLRQSLKEQMINHKITNGFVDILVTENVFSGINSLMQISGVAGFRPNTVSICFRFFVEKKPVKFLSFLQGSFRFVFLRIETAPKVRRTFLLIEIGREFPL